MKTLRRRIKDIIKIMDDDIVKSCARLDKITDPHTRDILDREIEVKMIYSELLEYYGLKNL
jgi:hypothetical protein